MSSNAFVLVTSSFFRKFLNAITNCGSDICERSGGSATYVREEGSLPWLENADEKPPKEPKVLVAARLLEAWDLNFLLIAWGRV